MVYLMVICVSISRLMIQDFCIPGDHTLWPLTTQFPQQTSSPPPFFLVRETEY
jgi:hypothetical protein